MRTVLFVLSVSLSTPPAAFAGEGGSIGGSIEMGAPSDAPAASPVRPSFDCRRATYPDEVTICTEARLAEMDQAVNIALSKVDRSVVKQARKQADEDLRRRHECGRDRLCILDQQVTVIQNMSGLGSKVPVPPWVGPYRLALIEQSRKPMIAGLPKQVGECATSKIATISDRFGDVLKRSPDDDTGTAIGFTNEGHLVSYSFVGEIATSAIGDQVVMCLVSIPRNCPKGDERGRTYSVVNLRTKGTWLLPDAQHMCGGA